MKIKPFWKNIFSDNKEEISELKQEIKELKKDEKNNPVTGFPTSRISQDKYSTLVPDIKTPIEPDFSRKIYDVLINLAAYNEDFGFALDNLVQLANTKQSLVFKPDTPEKLQDEITNLISDKENDWYGKGANTHSLNSDLLVQAILSGMCSIEAVPNKRLDNIQRIFRVTPKTIEFVYDKKNLEYKPFQRPVVTVNANSNGLVELNEKTYFYSTWRRLFESPYPTPPFLNALRAVIYQNDAYDNLGNILKKLGILGFLSVNVTPPQQNPGEIQGAYNQRCYDWLQNTVAPQVEKNMSKGFSVGFKDKHEFKLEGSNMNANGAKDIVEIIDYIITSGLKQDPNLLGRPYRTTETFGRVVLKKLINQTRDFQTMVGDVRLNVYRLFLSINGYDPYLIDSVKYETPDILDKKAEEEAKGEKIKNNRSLWDDGIIDQDAYAKSVGEKTFVVPKLSPQERAEEQARQAMNSNQSNTLDKKKSTIETCFKNLGGGKKEFKYYTIDCHGVTSENFKKEIIKFEDKKTDQLTKEYYNKIYTIFQETIKQASKQIANSLSGVDVDANIRTVEVTVLADLFSVFQNSFNNKLNATIQPIVNEMYDYFRKDKSIFPLKESSSNSFVTREDAVEAAFNLTDTRLISYYNNSDSYYLGKFITDKDTQKRVLRYIGENYVEGELPSFDNKFVGKFEKEFEEVLDIEAYKIRAIIATTVSNMRADANALYMQQAGVEKYEISEILDNLICPYCRHMHGKVFSVEKNVKLIERKIDKGWEDVSEVMPFATTVPKAEFLELDQEALSNKNIVSPAFHPGCRGKKIATF